MSPLQIRNMHLGYAKYAFKHWGYNRGGKKKKTKNSQPYGLVNHNT